ncbi:hypothetical protein QY97_03643 [Bacillus thermotolerans]|uniref:Uncharacterized protein n=1 Tax=Bacillus thermotolerans TaxID=1221996 RepID=A0A0F5HK58_BACTR|nr:hypothetical protein QY97_03643 [Bacillus thermotolerans]KKB35907.1 hypothetical protein QY95_03271 [Bacillus thermotolerans]
MFVGRETSFWLKNGFFLNTKKPLQVHLKQFSISFYIASVSGQ